ncbi:DnaB-like helicase C-terminal domain-containing protein [Bradyrhizobium sp. LA7.1]|uniref:replicative DNA helicase n=1 Tax=Bradyrhizobium sp. LA7.1 TaxID=3156324 RepID=UPI0033940D7D
MREALMMNAPIRVETASLASVELEQELLGSILINSQSLDIISREVSADDFSESLHAQLFETFISIRDANGVITPSLVIAAMGRDAGASLVEGTTLSQYVARLAANAAIISAVQAYARQIREFSNRRKILTLAGSMSIDIEANQSAAGIAAAGIEALDEIAAQSTAGATAQVSLREANEKSLVRMQFGMQNPGHLAGLSWGLDSLDNKTGGLKRGELFILAGRPSMGKTALAICIARNVASGGDPVFLSSLEMGEVSVSDRSLADAAYERGQPIPYYAIANGTLVNREAERVIEAARAQRDWPLKIDPAPGLTVSQIAGRARRYSQTLARQGKRLGLLVVDHMHIVTPSNRYSGARVNEVGEISAALKALAKELDVPVLALAQLSRALESREDKRPTMADLRDSGSIEQDADAIIFVYRESYYLERETATTAEKEAARIDRLIDVKDQLEAIIAKQRNGPTGTVHLFCDIGCNAIRDLEGRR